MRLPSSWPDSGPYTAMKVSRGVRTPARVARGSSSRMPPASDGTKSLARSKISRKAASRRTSQRSVSWSRRERTKKRVISSADSVRIGPGSHAGLGIDISSSSGSSGTPPSLSATGAVAAAMELLSSSRLAFKS
jgi:hypothetical protein